MKPYIRNSVCQYIFEDCVSLKSFLILNVEKKSICLLYEKKPLCRNVLSNHKSKTARNVATKSLSKMKGKNKALKKKSVSFLFLFFSQGNNEVICWLRNSHVDLSWKLSPPDTTVLLSQTKSGTTTVHQNKTQLSISIFSTACCLLY